MKDLTIRQLLDPLPRRICTYFASQVAEDVIQRSGTKDPDVLLAQAVAERYGNGEDFDEAYLKEVANKAYAAASAAAYSAYSAAYSAAASAVAYSAAASAAAAYSAAAYSAAASAATSATSVASAASAASAAAYSAHSAASAAAHSAYYAFDEENYKPLLLKILNERLTPLEFMLYFGEEISK